MEASELMIGNLIKLKNNLYQVDCESFSRDNIADINIIELCDPIPLTEEWLVKFGFKYLDELDIFSKWVVIGCSTTIQLKQNKKEFITIFNDVCISINYVHQLQNLYFALTGKELKIKE